MKVVHRSQNRNPLLMEGADRIQRFELATEVEVLSGLVKEQQARFLCQSESNLDPLTFSPAQLIEDAIPEGSDIGQSESALDRLAIAAFETGK